MGLHFLTEDQEKEILNKRYEYTNIDIATLACLASSVEALARAAIDSCQNLYNQGDCIPLFNAIETMIKPISDCLNEGVPMREKEQDHDG